MFTFAKTVKRQGEYIAELEKNIKLTKKNNKDIQKILIENFILTLNKIQDIEAINVTEEEKIEMRNDIINPERTKLVTKLIELSNATPND